MERVQEMADLKQKKLQKATWIKYHHITDIAMDILRKEKNVLMYGGTAINSMFPAKYKFYGKYEMPDIDIFAVNQKGIIKRLREAYSKAGLTWFNAYEALNSGTMKISVDGVEVADIHQVSRAVFNKMYVGSSIGDTGIRNASPLFLRMTLYKQLAGPINSNRWSKVFERLMLFNKLFPPATARCLTSAGKMTSAEAIALRNMRIILKATPYIIMAADVMLLSDKSSTHANVSTGTCIDIIASDIEAAATHIQREAAYLGTALGIIWPTTNTEDDVLLPRHMFLTMGSNRFIGIYGTGGQCVSYVMHRGMRIASLQLLIHMYSLMLIVKEHHYNLENIECVLNMLVALQMKSLKTKKPLLEQFVMDCYGEQSGVITLRRERHARHEAKRLVQK